MFSRIHQKLGNAGFAISIVALVLALTGGAYAAGKLTGKQKKEVEKIAKKAAKKTAKPGPAGPAGGPGAKGDTGAAGSNGTNGTAGANGKSVVASAASNTECTGGVGGTKFEVEGSGTPSHVCNGKNGQTGFTATLPPGQTETGSWSIGLTAVNDNLPKYAAISFPIPLAAPIASDHVIHVKWDEVGPSECEQGTSDAPAAAPGYFCVYSTTSEGFFTPSFLSAYTSGELDGGSSVEGAGTSGAILLFSGAEEAGAYGTFAVTAAVE
ncbi:MAG TPA: hypothetical protein VFU16_07160 [Solirubrobacterales bacterium]|nr:hypothetical protein [Solirubrobacterales bacterium]